MRQYRQLTQTEREAIAAKYQRRIIELGTPIFGPPDGDEEPGGTVVSFPDPNAEARTLAAEQGRAKTEEFQRRILEATIQLLEAAPPLDEVPPPHRKPGDLVRTGERLTAGEVDLPDPNLDRGDVAASLEAHAKFERAELAFGEEMDAVTLEALAGLEPVLNAITNFALDVFHIVKEWSLEDPEGPAAGYYSEMNRAWRKGAGRSRGREDAGRQRRSHR